jgi:hypothetical protein
VPRGRDEDGNKALGICPAPWGCKGNFDFWNLLLVLFKGWSLSELREEKRGDCALSES